MTIKITNERCNYFWARVDRSGDCWIWLAGRYGKTGYGAFSYTDIKGQHKTIGAHRAAFMLFKAPIPKGKFILHKCNNKLCVKPEHLYAGTQADNMIDRLKAGHTPRGENHYLAKLSNKSVTYIRNLKPSYGIFAAAARKLGVSKDLVTKVFYGEGWSHVACENSIERKG